MTTLTEAHVEQAALDWLSGLGWQVSHGSDIAPDTPGADAQTTVRWYWSVDCGTPSPN